MSGWLTDEPGLYAIGDVVGAPWLAHKASHEGDACAWSGLPGIKDLHPLDTCNNIPGCTYCTAASGLASGLTEAKAQGGGV